MSKLTGDTEVGRPITHRLGKEGVGEENMVDSTLLVLFVTLTDVGTQ
jgi:hypothetical protein